MPKKTSLFLLFLLSLFSFATANALPVLSKPGDSKTQPLVISAENGMTCDKSKMTCTAHGPVKVTKGTATLTCNKLVAHLKNTSRNKQEIETFEAFENVVFTDQKGGFESTSHYAKYQSQTGQLHLTGTPILKQTTKDLTIFAGTSVVFYEDTQMALTTGRTTVKSGDKLLQANVFRVYLQKDTNDQMTFQRLEANGNVILSTPTEIAQAKRGIYRAYAETAELYDDVKLTRKEGQLVGNYAQYDMKSGKSRIFNRPDGEYSPKRIQAILNPKTSGATQGKQP